MKRTLFLTAMSLSTGLLVFNACQSRGTAPRLANPNTRFQSQAEAQAQQRLSQQLRQRLQQISPESGANYFIQPESHQLNAIPQDPKNPLTPAKVALGQMLYHDTALGIDSKYPEGVGTYSCATCHHVGGGLQANRRQGISDGAIGFGRRGEQRRPSPAIQPLDIDFQPIRTPAAINTAWQKNMLWNGQFGANGANKGTESLWNRRQNSTLFIGIENNQLGFDGVETQALVGQEAHRLSLEKVKTIPAYQDMFAKAYPNVPPAQRITPVNAALAIASFERTMLSNKAPFQRWLKEEPEAMSAAELRGALAFFGKGQCGTCHTGPALNSMRFEALGLKDLVGPDIIGSNPDADQHKGRGSFTGRAEDMYKFKVPQLYNLADSPFYGHGGSIRSLEAFVSYMNQGKPENPRVPTSQLASSFKPLNLSASEQRDLVLFLKHSLRDPQLIRYQPKRVPSGQCVPNNDPASRRDLGC